MTVVLGAANGKEQGATRLPQASAIKQELVDGSGKGASLKQRAAGNGWQIREGKHSTDNNCHKGIVVTIVARRESQTQVLLHLF
ncbi:hypothetical protein GCM10011383_29690 [Hymenobacter cavernae]|uniref:Uncharacterized protein n=1 Tax=Hymenobacter cavernae TaxID=2044852 RepID=A0ABQ1UDB5_9BACT|nr:hypothetical protein GCM10011383_29690 [Hymenobacter cavernae]